MKVLATQDYVQAAAGVRTIDLFAAEASTHLDTMVRVAARRIDPTEFIGKTVTFRATIESSSHSVLWGARVQLFSVEDNSSIYASTIDNGAAPNKALPLEVSAVLTIWPVSPFTCEVQIRALGSTSESERAIITNARLEIT